MLMLATLSLGVLASLVPASDPEVVRPELRQLELHGTPYERGLAHGTALREEIGQLLEAFEADLVRSHQVPIAEYRERFLEATEFDEAVRRWCPDLLDEVRGMAAGAEVDFDRLFCFQLIDEHWSQGRAIAAHHCTSFGVSAHQGQPTLVAQNLDIPPFFHRQVVLLRIHDPHHDRATLVVTVPGLVGANGLNSRGVAVCVNTLLQLQPSPKGLPVAFVVRRLLQCRELGEALEFLNDATHASGQNYMLGDPREARSFECSADQLARFEPFEGARFTYHTNHPLRNGDVRATLTKGGTEPWKPRPGQCDRFDCLTGAFADPEQVPTIDDVRAALSNRDGPRVTIDNTHTFCTTIMELSNPPVLHLCPGRPADGEFQKFSF